MTCNFCRGLELNLDALPDTLDPRLTLQDAVGLYGVCPHCAEPEGMRSSEIATARTTEPASAS